MFTVWLRLTAWGCKWTDVCWCYLCNQRINHKYHYNYVGDLGQLSNHNRQFSKMFHLLLRTFLVCQKSIYLALYFSVEQKSLCLFGSNVTLEGKSSQQEEDEGKANFSKRLVASDFCTLKMPCWHASVRFYNLMIKLPRVHNVQLCLF